jgi:hypothetical protein
MRKAIPFVLGVSFAVAGSVFTAAQEPATMPKILQIQREFIKPGKSGAIHDKSESAFVEAAARSKWPTRYVAFNSMSGKSRALYISAYDSFDELQKSTEFVDKNPTLSAAIERASIADGDLLDAYDSAILSYREDLSYSPRPDLSNQKYMEIVEYHIHPGRTKEWIDETKEVVAAHKKAGTNANWAMYHLEYGADEGTYLLFSADTGLAEIDTGDAMEKKFREAMGDDGMKKLAQVTDHCVDSAVSQLFSINPKQSYPPDAWVKANPSFWKPKPMAPAAKPAADAAKPAAAEKKPAGQ